MSKNLTELKVIQFDDMVKNEYQAEGFILDDTVQMRRNVTGKTATFNLVGQGMAQEKTSQDDVPIMSPQYSKTIATLKGYVASDFVDEFDQQEVNFDELKILAKVAGMAIGRRKDQIVLDALIASTTTNTIAAGATNFTYEKFLELDEILNKSGVPMRSGRRFIALSASGIRALLKEQEFVSNDFVTNRILNSDTGMDRQKILGYTFLMIPDMLEGGLPKSVDTRTCFAWHEFAAGLAVGIDVTSEVNYIPIKTSWLTTAKFKAGAVEVDKKGIVKIDIDETK